MAKDRYMDLSFGTDGQYLPERRDDGDRRKVDTMIDPSKERRMYNRRKRKGKGLSKNETKEFKKRQVDSIWIFVSIIGLGVSAILFMDLAMKFWFEVVMPWIP